MIDEAFMPFAEIIERMLSLGGELVDDENGVRMVVSGLEIESPVELSIVREEDGTLRIGSTPPLYYTDTSIRPSFHHLTFTAVLERSSDGD